MNELKTLIATSLRIPAANITETTTMAQTPAWDSLAHMDLVLSIEEHYKINLEGDEIASMVSIAAIAAVLKGKGVTFS
jgi:acyl carrier protein